MAEQLLHRRKRHWWAIQSIGSRIKEGFGKRMAKIVEAERRSEFCGLTKLGNDLTNAAFGQRSAQTHGPETPLTSFMLLGCPHLGPMDAVPSPLA